MILKNLYIMINSNLLYVIYLYYIIIPIIKPLYNIIITFIELIYKKNSGVYFE